MMDLLDKTPISKEDYPRLALTGGSAFIFFWICYIVSAMYMASRGQNLIYQGLPTNQKALYISRIVANIHALVIVILVTIVVFFTCEDPRTFVFNDECLLYPSRLYAYVGSITAAYLIYDLFVCVLFIKEKSSLQTQTYIHHLVGLWGIIVSYWCGSFNIAISNASLITEFSTPFMNYRQIILVQKEEHKQIYPITSILFALTFFLFRILFYPLMIYRLSFGLNLIYNGQIITDKVLVYLSYANAFFYVVMFILQVFWFQKIIGVAIRSCAKLMGGSQTKKGDKKE